MTEGLGMTQASVILHSRNNRKIVCRNGGGDSWIGSKTPELIKFIFVTSLFIHEFVGFLVYSIRNYSCSVLYNNS